MLCWCYDSSGEFNSEPMFHFFHEMLYDPHHLSLEVAPEIKEMVYSQGSILLEGSVIQWDRLFNSFVLQVHHEAHSLICHCERVDENLELYFSL